MKQIIRLTPSEPTQQVNLNNFRAVALFVENSTGSPIAVRIGGTDIPSQANANHVVPALGWLLVPAEGVTFGFAFTDVSAVTTSALSGLSTSATLTLFDASERLPSFGSGNFQSLSLSDLGGGIKPFGLGTTSPTFDLGAWGGAVVYASPTPTSGQGALVLLVSSDGVAFSILSVYALWPSTPLILVVPRVARYLQVAFVTATIPGEPALAGAYSVRASLAEVQQIDFAPIGLVLSTNYNLPTAGSSIQKILYTQNLPAIHLTTDTPVGDVMSLTCDVSDSPTGPWRRIFKRFQTVAGGSWPGIDRSVSDLQQYMRVTVTNESSVPASGTLSFSIRNNPDFTVLLERLYQSVGDPTNPQEFFHLQGLLSRVQTQTNGLYQAQRGNRGNTISQTLGTPVGGAWLNTGNSIPNGSYIESIQVGSNDDCIVNVGYGTSLSVVAQFYAAVPIFRSAATMSYWSLNTPGILVVSPQNFIWVMTNVPATTLVINIAFTSSPP